MAKNSHAGKYMLMMTVKDLYFPWSKNSTFTTVALVLNYTIEQPKVIEVAPTKPLLQEKEVEEDLPQQYENSEEQKMQNLILALEAE